MKARAIGFAIGLLASFLLAVAPAKAQSVDDKIKALEQELIQRKDPADRDEERSDGGGSGVADVRVSSGQRFEYRSGG